MRLEPRAWPAHDSTKRGRGRRSGPHSSTRAGQQELKERRARDGGIRGQGRRSESRSSTGPHVTQVWSTGPRVAWEETQAKTLRPREAWVEMRAEASEPHEARVKAQGGASRVEGKPDRIQ
jgi:hypothetical protein